MDRIITTMGTSQDDFERWVGRKPTKKEFESWVHYLGNGIEAQLDWDIIYTCASKYFKVRK